MDTAIRINTLSKTFSSGRKALQGVDIHIASGEMVALIGASGSGKSTLLRHIAGLMAGNNDAQGSIEIHGKSVQKNGKIVSNIRSVRSGIGFVFQQFNLVGRLPVITNVNAKKLRTDFLNLFFIRPPRLFRFKGFTYHFNLPFSIETH